MAIDLRKPRKFSPVKVKKYLLHCRYVIVFIGILANVIARPQQLYSQ